jgi:predicted metal-dependent hydrolase
MTDKFAAYQMNLIFHRTESELRELLEKGLRRHVRLVLTKNSSSMLSAQVREGVTHVRLHEMFLTAGMDVIDEIIGFIGNKRRCIPLFRSFVRYNSVNIREKPSRKITVRTSGRHHDLRELFNDVNREYFEDKIEALITWGTGRIGLWVRKRTLGSYSPESNLIRINPVLDSSKVPRYYLKYVVFHEMLHAHLGAQKKGARRCIHSSEFRRQERMFRDYDRAIVWERKSAG